MPFLTARNLRSKTHTHNLSRRSTKTKQNNGINDGNAKSNEQSRDERKHTMNENAEPKKASEHQKKKRTKLKKKNK